MSKEWDALTKIFSNLRQVARWGHFNTYAKKHNLPTARTWDPFLEKLKDECIDPKRCLEVSKLIQFFYLDQIVGGDRVIQIFESSDTERAALNKRLSSVEIPKSIGSKYFPYLIDGLHHKEIPTIPTLVGKRIQPDGGVILSFLSGRYVEERTKYRTDEVGEAVRKAFNGFDQFIAIKLNFHQCFDAILVPADGSRIEVRLDLPTLTNMDYAAICAQQLLEQFHLLFPGKGGASVMGARKNLFPAINKMYRDSQIGQVVELGFETSTDSVKVEKMRDKNSDLRKELYHKTGKAAIKLVTPFRVAVRFDHKSSARTELLLPGNFRELNRNPSILEFAVIEGSLIESDIREVTDTLLRNI